MSARRLATLALGAICAAVTWASPATAGTPGADFAQLTMSSESGDLVGQGLDYSYSTPSMLFYGQSDGNAVHVYAYSPDFNDSWFLHFAAQRGERLSPGTYENVVAWPSVDGAHAAMSIGGNHVGCGPLRGTFEVLQADYGPNETIQRFHATFEQHCLLYPNVYAPALRGEIQLVNHPWRQPVQVSLAIDTVGSRQAGKAVVHGTITCNVPGTTVGLYVSVSQDDGQRRPSFGDSWQGAVECGPSGLPWSTTVESIYYESHGEQEKVANANPFLPGPAEVHAVFSVDDGTYGFYLEQESSATVDLGH
jgi:hypothetical protein